MTALRDLFGLQGIGNVSIMDVGEILAPITSVRIRDADGLLYVWEEVADIAVAVPASAYGAQASSNTVPVNTANCIATATGGDEPYTYLWSFVSGDSGFTIATPNAIETRFSGNVDPASQNTALFKLTVTDAFGRSVDSSSVTVTVQNFGAENGGF